MKENASSVFSLSDGKKKSALREQVSIFFRGNRAFSFHRNIFFSSRALLFLFFSLSLSLLLRPNTDTFR